MRFGYNGAAFNFRQTPQDEWGVSYGPCSRPTLRFNEECFKTAQLIRDKNPGEIVLLLSGGVDSEVMLRSFVEQRIQFKVAIMEFKDGLNAHDVGYARKICETHGLRPHIFSLDLLRFWENDLFAYADPVYCCSPQLLPHMWLIDQIDGYPVMGSGECLLVKRRPADYIPGKSPYTWDEWDLFEKEKIASWYRHLMIRNRPGCMGFYQYNPEIILSYLLDPFVKKLTNCELSGKLTTESSKFKIYSQYFNLKERLKYHGFENVPEWDRKYRSLLLAKYGHASAIAKTPVKNLIQQLTATTQLPTVNRDLTPY